MSRSTKGSPEKWPRKRAVTRERIIQAAAEVLAERGFQNTSLDAIAAHAGLTKGSVYSNFESKDELFLAVMSQASFRLQPKLSEKMSLEAYFRALGEAAVAMLPRARAQSAYFAEFLLYVLTHDEIRQRMVTRYGELFQDAKSPLEAGERFALPPKQMGDLVQALTLGLMFQHMLTPEAITPDLVRKAFGLLAAKSVRA